METPDLRSNSSSSRVANGSSKTLIDVTTAYENVVYAHSAFNPQDAEHLLNRVQILAKEAAR